MPKQSYIFLASFPLFSIFFSLLFPFFTFIFLTVSGASKCFHYNFSLMISFILFAELVVSTPEDKAVRLYLYLSLSLSVTLSLDSQLVPNSEQAFVRPFATFFVYFASAFLALFFGPILPTPSLSVPLRSSPFPSRLIARHIR